MSPRLIRKRWFYSKNRQRKIMKRLQWFNCHHKHSKYMIYEKEFKSGKRILKYLDSKKFFISKFSTGIKEIFNNIHKKTPELSIPRIFSFIKNPEGTINVLKKLVTYGKYSKVRSIFIDHSKCEELGICASTVMDTLILSIKDKHKTDKEFHFHGQTSLNRNVNEILAASGLIHHLHIYEGKLSNVKCLELLHNESSADMAQKIIEYLSGCLETQGFLLNRKGQRDMGEMISEVIDNCNQHSKLNEWFALGHYSKDNDQKGKVQLVIFNFGKTIFESFKDKGSQESMYNRLKNKAKTINNNFKNCPSTQSLITMYALQDGISRFKTQNSNVDRGSGTIKLISIFQAIGRDSNGLLPSMSITSGKTHIIFNEKYKMRTQLINGVKKKIIAFNEENDINKPPDIDNVKDLNTYFPGTVISMEFFIDRGYLGDILSRGEQFNETSKKDSVRRPSSKE